MLAHGCAGLGSCDTCDVFAGVWLSRDSKRDFNALTPLSASPSSKLVITAHPLSASISEALRSFGHNAATKTLADIYGSTWKYNETQMTPQSITMVCVCGRGYLRYFLKFKSQSRRRLRRATDPHHPSPQASLATVRVTAVAIVTVVGMVVIVVGVTIVVVPWSK